jgi:magnesium chelatase family protein
MLYFYCPDRYHNAGQKWGYMDFNRIKGQEHAKRGLEIALAGGHSVLLVSPPQIDTERLTKATREINSLLSIRTMTPCPCGYFTDPKHECTCTPEDIHKHLALEAKNGTADICLEVPRLNTEMLSDKRRGEASAVVIERIKQAQSRETPTTCDKEADELLKLAILELGISSHAYDKIIRVAGTIAQLDDKAIIEAHHISEAISYRSLDRNLWG